MTTIKRTPRYLIALLFLLIFGFPIVWLTYNTFKTLPQFTKDVWSLPRDLYLENYTTVLLESSIPRYYLNSIIVSSASVTGLTLFAAMAGYIFARVRFRGREAIFYFLLAGMMIPVHVTLIPVYLMLRDLNLLDTYWALIFPYIGFGLPVSIFILRGFFKEMPLELEEAARIDGCSIAGIFWRIMLPLARPAITTVVIFNLVNTWNGFLFALTFLNTEEKRTLPLGIMEFSGTMGTLDYPLVFTGLALATIPILIVYFIAQRQIIKGLMAGALKG